MPESVNAITYAWGPRGSELRHDRRVPVASRAEKDLHATLRQITEWADQLGTEDLPLFQIVEDMREWVHIHDPEGR